MRDVPREAGAALPRHVSHPASRMPHPDVSHIFARMKVLVIEDDPTVGQFVKRGLEEQRWGVDLVADGEEGEQLALTGTYDLIILDMRLPGKSGLQVLNG